MQEIGTSGRIAVEDMSVVSRVGADVVGIERAVITADWACDVGHGFTVEEDGVEFVGCHRRAHDEGAQAQG